MNREILPETLDKMFRCRNETVIIIAALQFLGAGILRQLGLGSQAIQSRILILQAVSDWLKAHMSEHRPS